MKVMNRPIPYRDWILQRQYESLFSRSRRAAKYFKELHFLSLVIYSKVSVLGMRSIWMEVGLLS